MTETDELDITPSGLYAMTFGLVGVGLVLSGLLVSSIFGTIRWQAVLMIGIGILAILLSPAVWVVMRYSGDESDESDDVVSL